MFLKNKYSACYFNIVNRAKSRLLEENTYIENHHIIPKSLGGNNSKDNLVKLTAREHFICHILLTKMTTGQEKYKMIHAAIGMKRSRKYQKRYINSRLYEQVRKDFAIISGNRNKGKHPSKETRKKMSKAGKGRIFTEEKKTTLVKHVKACPTRQCPKRLKNKYLINSKEDLHLTKEIRANILTQTKQKIK